MSSVFLESPFSLEYFNSNLACRCPLFQYGGGESASCGSLVDALTAIQISYALDIPQNKSMELASCI